MNFFIKILANLAMIKSEIVEFMKYRAPIDLLTSTSGKKGLYSKLTEVQKHIEVMPAEMEIQNNKLDYYNKENELMEKAAAREQQRTPKRMRSKTGYRAPASSVKWSPRA